MCIVIKTIVFLNIIRTILLLTIKISGMRAIHFHDGVTIKSHIVPSYFVCNQVWSLDGRKLDAEENDSISKCDMPTQPKSFNRSQSFLLPKKNSSKVKIVYLYKTLFS